jgi:hypothetical protein
VAVVCKAGTKGVIVTSSSGKRRRDERLDDYGAYSNTMSFLITSAAGEIPFKSQFNAWEQSIPLFLLIWCLFYRSPTPLFFVTIRR